MVGHLIHIGYPKAGSTFLQHWFQAHPQIAYRKGGLAGFNDVWQISKDAIRPDPGIRCRVTSSESLATPAASREFASAADVLSLTVGSERRACDLLCAAFPASDVLIVTRGFRAIILSSYSQYVRTGGDRSLKRLIEDAAQSEVWHYDRLIELYRDRFGDDRVLVLPFELLRDDAPRFVRLLELRLGLDMVPFSSGPVNQALSPVELAWYPHLSALVRRVSSRASDRLRPLSFTNRLRRPIQLLQRLRPLQPVDGAVIDAKVVHAFRGRAELLRELPEDAPSAAEYLI